jgi:hypothetical protein
VRGNLLKIKPVEQIYGAGIGFAFLAEKPYTSDANARTVSVGRSGTTKYAGERV